MVNWQPVTSVDQIKVGTKLKILAFSERDCYRAITVKKLVDCHGDTEVIINLKKNYFFNLNSYLEKRPMWGKWVDKVWYKAT